MSTRHTRARFMGSLSRRRFLRSVPAVAAASLAAPTHGAQEEKGLRFGAETLRCAEQVTGVPFSAADEALMLPGVNRFRDHFDAIRALGIPLTTEPFSFRHAVSPPPAVARRPTSAPKKRGKTVRPSPEELPFLPVTELARLIRSRMITSRELTELYLDRLTRYDPILHCVVTVTAEVALAQATAADRELRSGRSRGPLHGIPWGVKDLFATRGIRTTWGARPYEHQMIDTDATVVERLRERGAVLLAKLTSGELAIGDVWFGGKTRNPWDPERGSSGSSAGPASATAAGLVGFAVGTETNGSIVSPASTCGIVGFRPTYGRVSRHGVMALRWSFDKIGPLCRCVEDAVLVFDAIRGPDGRDRAVIDAPFHWQPDSPLGGLRVGFIEREFEEPSAEASEEDRKRWPGRRAVLVSALDTFRRIGVSLTPLSLPGLPARSIYTVLSAEAGAAFDGLVRSGKVDELTGKGPNDRANQLRSSRFIPAVEYIQAQRARTVLFEDMQRLFAGCDAFISPTDSASVTMTNLTGHPAVTLNAGFADGLPEGVMITGRLFDEGTPLRLARAFEDATDWHTKRPGLKKGSEVLGF